MTAERDHRFTVGNRWRGAGVELDLAEVLAEPMVHLLMRRDGVSPCALRRVVAAARAALRRGLCPDLAA
ncbi:MAG TPA: hypothetical protein VN823_13230 [Stellaceae bacterium]|nr:hypothetical protein [Stellaceae bacterium]